MEGRGRPYGDTDPGEEFGSSDYERDRPRCASPDHEREPTDAERKPSIFHHGWKRSESGELYCPDHAHLAAGPPSTA
jgi:hypothetical protein